MPLQSCQGKLHLSPGHAGVATLSHANRWLLIGLRVAPSRWRRFCRAPQWAGSTSTPMRGSAWPVHQTTATRFRAAMPTRRPIPSIACHASHRGDPGGHDARIAHCQISPRAARSPRAGFAARQRPSRRIIHSRWQAARWPGETSRKRGISDWQRWTAIGQRS